jgi:aryl-alcohol dehydrogenase-like predicted oxidoreductase
MDPLFDDVGRLGFGCWRMMHQSTAEVHELIDTALANGISLIDTAAVYGFGVDGFGDAEARLGELLRQAPVLRAQLVIATKGGIVPPVPYDSADLVTQCDDSLRRLHVDVIDLYQVHRPDPFTHPADVAAQLDHLVESGKVRAIGVSNYSPSQTAVLVSHLATPLASIQPELSIMHTDAIFDGTLDQAIGLDAAVLAWSPLAQGRLADVDGPLGELLDALAAQHEVTRTAIAMAWVMHHPSAPIALIGTQQPKRIVELVAARSVALSRTDLYGLMSAAGVHLP